MSRSTRDVPQARRALDRAVALLMSAAEGPVRTFALAGMLGLFLLWLYIFPTLRDGNGFYAVLSSEDPETAFFEHEYIGGFGSDDFVYIGFEVDNGISQDAIKTLKAVHTTLVGLTIETDLTLDGSQATLREPAGGREVRLDRYVDPRLWARVHPRVVGDRGLFRPVVHLWSILNYPSPDIVAAGRPDQLGCAEFGPALHALCSDTPTPAREGVEAKPGGKPRYLAVWVQLVDLEDRDDIRQVVLGHIHQSLNKGALRHGRTPFQIAGAAEMMSDNAGQVHKMQSREGPLMAGVVVLCLLVAFRGRPRLLLVPLVALSLTAAAVHVVIRGLTEVTWMTNVLPIAMLVIVVSTANHLLFRYRLQLQRRLTPELALAGTAKQVLVPCVVTAGVIALSFVVILRPHAPVHKFAVFAGLGALSAILTILFTLLCSSVLLKFISGGTVDMAQRSRPRQRDYLDEFVEAVAGMRRRITFATLVGLVAIAVTLVVTRDVNEWPALQIDTDARAITDEEFKLFEDHFRGSYTYAFVLKEHPGDGACHGTPGVRCSELPAVDDLPATPVCLGPRTLAAMHALRDDLRAADAPDAAGKWTDYEYPAGAPLRQIRGTTHTVLDLMPRDRLAGETPQTTVDDFMRWLADIDGSERGRSQNHAVRFFFNTFADGGHRGCMTRVIRIGRADRAGVWNQLRTHMDERARQVTGRTDEIKLTGTTDVFNRTVGRIDRMMWRAYLYANAACLAIGVLLTRLAYRRWSAAGLLAVLYAVHVSVTLALLAAFGLALDWITATLLFVSMSIFISDATHVFYRLGPLCAVDGTIRPETPNHDAALRAAVCDALRPVLLNVISLSCSFLVLVMTTGYKPMLFVGKLLLVVVASTALTLFVALPALLLTQLDILRRPARST